MSAHPLFHLGFESLLSRTRFPGTADPSSGRTIVQPTRDPAVNQALATAAMPAYTERLREAIRHIPGAELAASRARKNPRRLDQKIAAEGQPAETVSDYGAAQIMVDSPQAKDAVVTAVKQHFRVLREQDHFATGDPEYHYRNYQLQLQMPNGASEELQIVPREGMEANRQEHHDYKRARNAELAARAKNDAAMEKFSSRNGGQVAKGPVVKGARVRLADGSVAKVAYVDPNLRIARVRTEDGRNVSVRYSDLRGTS